MSGRIGAVIAIVLGAFMMSSAQAAPEQALIVRFEHAGDWSDFFTWEPGIDDAITESGAEYDGNELAVDGSDGTIYMYGLDADRLLEVAKPYLLSATFLHNIVATLRYGDVRDPNAKERKVVIKP